MRVRTVISGIAAGVICLAVLWFQIHNFELSKVIPAWPVTAQAGLLPSWIFTALMGFCGIVLFFFGWVSARWNWGENWHTSLQAGIGAGIIAGCLIFDFVGVPWYSVTGQAEILVNALNPVSEVDGTRMLIEAILRTGTHLYVFFVVVVFVCAAVAGLGGLFSALIDRRDFWGSDPRRPEDWLFHLPAYLLSLFGYLNVIVTIAVLRLLWEKTLNSIIELGKQYDVQWTLSGPYDEFLLFGYLAGMSFALLAVGMTWGWIIRRWFVRERPGWLAAIWIFVTTLGIASLAPRGTHFSPPLDLILLVLAFLTGLILGLMTRERSEGFPYHPSDWIGFGLTYGILGGTQIVMSVFAYGSALWMVAIPNVDHLVRGESALAPIYQVISLFRTQIKGAGAAILGSLLVGLVVAGLVSFFRTVLGVRDVPPEQVPQRRVYYR